MDLQRHMNDSPSWPVRRADRPISKTGSPEQGGSLPRAPSLPRLCWNGGEHPIHRAETARGRIRQRKAAEAARSAEVEQREVAENERSNAEKQRELAGGKLQEGPQGRGRLFHAGQRGTLLEAPARPAYATLESCAAIHEGFIQWGSDDPEIQAEMAQSMDVSA
jgi:hypothetical protein